VAEILLIEEYDHRENDGEFQLRIPNEAEKFADWHRS
jgi:hypothetical protein